MKVAKFYKQQSNRLTCLLCPLECSLASGKTGKCFGKKNIDNTLYAVNYGKVASVAIDPIEKKPLYHFKPGSTILSTGQNGCNLSCSFCQNWQISQQQVPTRSISADELAKTALTEETCGIAYTYSEPLIWWEFLRDVCPAVRKKGLSNVLVTNGFINEKPLRQLLPFIDAMNIDLKSFNPTFYGNLCGGKLDDVLRTISIASEYVHLEITTLLIPGENDSVSEIEKLTDFIATLNVNIPLHFSAYSPRYKLDRKATPPSLIEKAILIAEKKLNFVYAGNISLKGKSDTLCPGCSNVLIRRNFYKTDICGIKDGLCSDCGRKADIVF